MSAVTKIRVLRNRAVQPLEVGLNYRRTHQIPSTSPRRPPRLARQVWHVELNHRLEKQAWLLFLHSKRPALSHPLTGKHDLEAPLPATRKFVDQPFRENTRSSCSTGLDDHRSTRHHRMLSGGDRDWGCPSRTRTGGARLGLGMPHEKIGRRTSPRALSCSRDVRRHFPRGRRSSSPACVVDLHSFEKTQARVIATAKPQGLSALSLPLIRDSSRSRLRG